DDAYIEIGKTYVVLKENDKAIETFAEIEKKFSRNHQLIRQARLQIAMLQYNDGKTDAALESYKQLVRTYPSSEEARISLEAIENILVEDNRVSEYTEFVNALGKGSIQIAPSREDSLLFRAAQRVYSRNEIPQAISSFEKYLDTYPKGRYSTTARYLLASCYYTQKQPAKALPLYKALLSDKENPNQEETLARAAEISYDLGQYAESMEYFKQLEAIGSSENKMVARIGLMRASYILKRYDETVTYATNFISLHSNNLELLREAQHKRMLSYLELNKAQNALPDMQILAKDTRNAFGAEAKYLLATHYYLAKQYESAEKEVFDFIDKGTPHHKWLAKAFILLADVYMEQDNYFEAKQYLLSLKSNYPKDDVEIASEINTRLEEIAKIENEKVNN
ncbi:MAG TPA: tetratricopeptide repeat protein, partial [Paludibacteraceae bacterium]|nr:tetratricopeptide repeat protein [Paludibacteraceae bacterium]